MNKMEEDEEEDESEDNEDNIPGTEVNVYPATTAVTKQLPRFDMSEFYNLNSGPEAKELLAIMNR